MWKIKTVLVVERIIKTKQVNWFLIALIKCPNYDLYKINKSYHLPALLPFQHKGREKIKKQKITRIFYKLFVWCLYFFFFCVFRIIVLDWLRWGYMNRTQSATQTTRHFFLCVLFVLCLKIFFFFEHRL